MFWRRCCATSERHCVNVDFLRACSAFVATCLLGAPSARAEDLLSTWRLASSHDSALLSARHAYEAALERLPQARAGLLPAVGLTGNSAGQSGQSAFERSAPADRGVHSRNWSVQIVQPLWRPVQRIAYEQAERQEQMAGERLRLAQQDAILRLAQAYFDALLTQESLRVSEGQYRAVQTQLALATRQFEVGTSTVTDVHEAHARSDLALAQVQAAHHDVASRGAELERLVGRLSTGLSTLGRSGVDWPPLPDGDADAWAERARVQHPAVRIQEAALAVAELETARSEAAHGPTLDLVASYGRNFASGSMASPADISSRVQAAQLGVNFSLPLFAGGSVSARVREAQALRLQAEDDLETARRDAAVQARQAWSGVRQGRLRSAALASAVESSRSAVEDNRIGYRIGTRINIDVLNAEQQLYASQREWFKARVDTLMQALRLKASNGLLQEDELAAINRMLAS
ncbi:TolC family outer membrane protein [Xylophilus sp. Kf1]|nr:TolC family outer membrane protein [Xylophilus sp. Kf1]